MEKRHKIVFISIPVILALSLMIFSYFFFIRKPKEEKLTPVNDEYTLTGDTILYEDGSDVAYSGEVEDTLIMSAQYAADRMLKEDNTPIYTWVNPSTKEKIVRTDIRDNSYEYYIDGEYIGNIFYSEEYQDHVLLDGDNVVYMSYVYSLLFPCRRVDIQGIGADDIPREALYDLTPCMEQYLEEFYPGNDFHFAYYEEDSIYTPAPDLYIFWIKIPDLNNLEIECFYYATEKGYDFRSILEK